MNDGEISKLWEDRAEWLSANHRAESFTIYFDADQSAVVISTGYARTLIPMDEISDFSGVLTMMANQLSLRDLFRYHVQPIDYRKMQNDHTRRNPNQD